MLTTRLCGVSSRISRQPLAGSGWRSFWSLHNHSAFRKMINESDTQWRRMFASGSQEMISFISLLKWKHHFRRLQKLCRPRSVYVAHKSLAAPLLRHRARTAPHNRVVSIIGRRRHRSKDCVWLLCMRDRKSNRPAPWNARCSSLRPRTIDPEATPEKPES